MFRAAGTRFEGMFLSPRQVRALLTDPALQVHDNPRAFLACNYDPAKALCHPALAAGPAGGHPTLDRCNPASRALNMLTAENDALRRQISRPRGQATPAPPGSGQLTPGRPDAGPARPGQLICQGSHLRPGRCCGGGGGAGG